jgi:hypothetical protein
MHGYSQRALVFGGVEDGSMMNALKFGFALQTVMAPHSLKYCNFSVLAFARRWIAVTCPQDKRPPADKGRLVLFWAGKGAS